MTRILSTIEEALKEPDSPAEDLVANYRGRLQEWARAESSAPIPCAPLRSRGAGGIEGSPRKASCYAPTHFLAGLHRAELGAAPNRDGVVVLSTFQPGPQDPVDGVVHGEAASGGADLEDR